MVIEILVILLIILVVFLFLLFIKPWHLHIIFKNNNEDYDFFAIIKILIFCIVIQNLNETMLEFKINIFSKSFKLFNFNINRKKSKNDIEQDSTEEEGTEKLQSKLKELYPLLYEAKKDCMDLIKVIVGIVEFEESFSIINIGVSDNNLTIKICNMLWTLTAPLYSINFRVSITPEIDSLILKTDTKTDFKIYSFNILRIIYLFITRKHLRNLIKFFI